MAQSLMRNHEVSGLIPGLARGLKIRHCPDLWCRSQTRLGSLVALLWRRPAAAAPIILLAWEPPYSMGAALEKAKKQKKKNKNKKKKTHLKEAAIEKDIRFRKT